MPAYPLAGGIEPRREAERILWRPDPGVPPLELTVQELLRRP